MFPWADGFQWTAGQIIFLSLFFGVLAVIGTTVVLAWIRASRDAKARKIEAIRWAGAFQDLPERDRLCRHMLTGEFAHRICNLKLDCRDCDTHARWVSTHPAAAGEESICGLHFPKERLYHRGHSWAKPEDDGTVTVGLDELGRRLIGTPDVVELPPVGSHLAVNGAAWRMMKRGTGVRVLSPVDGEVLETGGPESAWYLRVRPDAGARMTHLLWGAEVKAWIRHEIEKLQLLVSGDAAAPSMADGGVLVEDVSEACPADRWDATLSGMFLDN